MGGIDLEWPPLWPWGEGSGVVIAMANGGEPGAMPWRQAGPGCSALLGPITPLVWPAPASPHREGHSALVLTPLPQSGNLLERWGPHAEPSAVGVRTLARQRRRWVR